MNAQTVKKPDFAYPKTVSKQALSELESASGNTDGPTILRALLDFYLAESRISADNINESLKKMDSIASTSSDLVLKSMIRTLEADIYSSVYTSNRWKYDARTLPLIPFPEDYNQWSGEQFRSKINSLLDSALTDSDILKSTALKTYAPALSLGKTLTVRNETLTYYPTIFDFVANKAISLLSNTGNLSHILSWGLLTRSDLYVQTPFNKFDPTAYRILDLYASLLRFHRSLSAPFIISDLHRLDFVTSHIWNDGNPQELSPFDRKAELLTELYNENRSSEYSGDILLEMNRDDADRKKWLAAAIKRNLSTFPSFSRNNNLRNMLADIEMKSVDLSYPNKVAPGSAVKFSLAISNVMAGKLYIYNVSSSPVDNESYNCVGLPSSRPAAVIPFAASAGAEIPFSEKIVVEHKFTSPGQYIAIATIDGDPNRRREWHSKIYVSDYALASSSFDKTMIWALNSTDGSPVEGAKVSIIPYSHNSRTQLLVGTTSAEGSVVCTHNGDAIMDKGGDRFATPLGIYSRNSRSEGPDWRETAAGYPALPLYHPGDSVEWMAICYEYKGHIHRPLAAKEVTAILRDAKYQALDTVKLTTDNYGRVTSHFLLPKETLSGDFCISINDNSDPVRFTVSDYKLPTFRVILDPVEKDYPAAGDVTLRGRVQTYTGFPIADAKISLSLSAMQPLRWWWGRSSTVKFHTLESVSDEAGNIEIVISKQTLDLSPIPGGLFNAELTAMSTTGESQLASTVFSTGLRYAIRASVPTNIDITAPTTAIKVEVVDYRDSIVRIPVQLAVIRDSVEVLRREILPGKAALDLSEVNSGRYELKFSIADSTLAAPVTHETVLYRPSDTATPLPGNLLWYPTAEVITDGPTGDGVWVYAVDCPTNLLVSVYTPDTLLSQAWIKAPKGMNRLPVHLPDDIDSATVLISLTGKQRNTSATLTVKRDITRKAIRFVAETFRDRTVPGSEETWTFRVVDQSGNGKQSAVVMDMYNTALDALTKTDWSFSPSWSWNGGYHYQWRQNDLSSTSSNTIYYRPGKRLSQNFIFKPEFDTYGLPLYNRFMYTSGLKIRGSRSYANDVNVVREHKDEVYAEEAVIEEIAVTYDATSASLASAKMAKVEMADSDAGVGEAEEAEESLDDSAQARTTDEVPFSFRDREVPLAFFKPMLQTDADGNLSLTFTVPNANATWGLRAVAFTDSLLSTSFASEIVASKPVMVQPNLPRFVRAGDIVRIEAAIMNGSDKGQTIETVIELFNAIDGKTVKTHHQTDTVNSFSASTAAIELTAPTDAPFIGYRIKSSAGNFADGEQTLLPVLPAVMPVIDTYPFYIAPDQDKFTMNLPVTPDDAKITLQYCDNPTWYVVAALPGLLDVKASTANEAGASIFSAAIAAGLLRDNPAIAAALKEWNSGEKSDAILTSMLEKNEDLKQVLLAATPWMLDAKNDSERMNRLSLLFDEKTVKNTISTNISTLRKLQRNGGGWAWYSMSKNASQWTTENLLLLFGRLRELGFMPDSRELNGMILSALRWIDSETRKDFKKYPDGDYSLYSYLRGFYKDMPGAQEADSRIINQTVQRILAEWKTTSVFNKAVYARILAWNSYPFVAREVLISLREYAETTPTKGMWWPSLDDMTIWSMGKTGTTALILDAFAAIEPGCADIDLIRQWLIIQKEAKDWGTSVTTSSVIASILATSGKWIEPAGHARISVGGKEVTPSKIERLTGSFRTPVDLKVGKSTELKVTRSNSASAPAWGAMFYLYTDSITSIKASSCPELAIDKKFVVENGLDSSFADSLSVGQRVHVTLTLTVDRDMDYVTIIDERPACFEPVEQLPEPIFAEGIYFYRENRDSSTRFFIDRLPKGTYILNYDMWVNNAGRFASGTATIQSQYAPQFTAHTSGSQLTVASGK